MIKKTYLMHSGVKGQKWGIRRYQNEDGTLTDAGKARYRNDGTKLTSENATNKELEYANSRLIQEQNYNRNTGQNYKNPGVIKRAAIAIGASTVGSFLVGFLGKLALEKVSDTNAKIGKDTVKQASIMGLSAATLGLVVSTTSSVGGHINSSPAPKKKK